ncbi:outer membrane beta-barrel protein [Helicobacter pylori]|uniref:Outer membrane protein HomC n=1 Tax=Helicobacter pylori NQ4053 TaxID=992027 RepID=I9QD90_HELPX|nr:outer membrane beta-barrel protein [Helicobacter pylori]EJB32546.1 outer membrane protein HomC [Helicobacter pylori NQ4053]
MLKLVSRTICLSLIGLFNPLEAFQKNQKDGFFIEAGFETGLLEGTQTKEQTITQNTQNTQKIYENPLTHPQTKEQNKSDTATPQSAYGKYYIPQSTILKNATALFTTDNIENGLTFYSQSPVYANMVNGSVTIQNFLPYNLNNVELSFKDAQGKVVNLGVIETIPKDSQIILPASLFNDSEFEQADSFNYQQLQATATQFSDANTQSLFEKLSKITTNVTMSYENADTNNFKGNCHDCVSDFTPQTAEELTNLMLDMIAVFDSKSWEEAVLNAPFQFSNSPSECGSDFPKCVNPFNNGRVAPIYEKYVLTPQSVIDAFRRTINLEVNILKSGFVGLGYELDDNDGNLGIEASALNPEKLFGKTLNKVDIVELRDIIHEFSHTKGYTHNGNMTYQRVRLCQENGGAIQECEGGKEELVNGKEELKFTNGKEVKDQDGYTYDVCSRFGGKNQPAFPSNYPNSIYTDCSQVPAGLIGVTSAVWQQLIDQNALPVDYTNLSSQTNYLNASLNTQDFATTMLSAISQSLSSSKSSTTTYRTSKTSRPFGAPLLGVNLKMGYQKYFNDYLGLSSYGIIKYNYAQANNEKIQQLSYGVGMDVLFDFITNYTNEKNPKNNLTKKVFTSSLGVFGGLRGLYNSYYLLNQYKGSGNLNVTGGLNYRYKHSKYSIGISVPLVQLKSRVVSRDGAYTNSITLNEGGSHFKVFFNYGWVF